MPKTARGIAWVRRPTRHLRAHLHVTAVFGFIITGAVMVEQVNVAAAADYNPDTGYLPNRTTYGDLGIIEMPSARMAQDGQLSITGAEFKSTQRYALGFQILPWLEASFRYSRVEDRRPFLGPDYDRSFGLKMRLFQEGEWTPEVSLGIRDLVGTGLLSEEYLVATKSVWSFDFSGGLGWGRLASDNAIRNPFGLVFRSFNNRPQGHKTGQVNFGNWFHGRYAGIFGGVIWHTPIENLDLLAEYSSDRYTRESNGLGPFRYKSPFNFGIAYHPLDWLSLSTSWLYGDAIGFTIGVAADPTQPNFPARLGPQPMPVTIRTGDEREAAVAGYVTDRAQIRAVTQTGAWVDVTDHRDMAKARLTSELTDLDGRVADFEIDGQTLAVNLRGARDQEQRCRIYARLAANSGLSLRSVAVTDLQSANGKVAVCEVPQIQAANEQPPARNDDGDLIAANATTNTRLEPDTPPQPAQTPNVSEIEQKIRADADAQSIGIDAIRVGEHDVLIYLDNENYYFESEAIGRMARILMADAPPNVEVFRIVSDLEGVPVRETRIERAPMERMFMAYGQPREIAQAISIVPAASDNRALDATVGQRYPAFSWMVSPQLREALFDPNSPIQLELTGLGQASIALLPGLSLNAGVDGSIWNDYVLRRRSNSKLPHVRSDVYQYLKHGINGINTLSVDYMTTVAPDVYVMGRAGILEDMFAGAGAQILWRPEGERWAVGADVYQVWQRGFDRLFDLRNYHTVTGHVSVYYESPWYGLDFAVHAGRYLAGDYGATLEIKRRFDTGVEIGAWATFTNVPFQKFGEGSFDKGIYINIPLEWLLPFFTQSSYSLALRPLTRDGGQRVAGDDSLYGLTESTSENTIASHISDIAYPPR